MRWEVLLKFLFTCDEGQGSISKFYRYCKLFKLWCVIVNPKIKEKKNSNLGSFFYTLEQKPALWIRAH